MEAFNVGEVKWQLIAERQLNLVGTKIVIVYIVGGFPYHVHRENACHGVSDSLEEAKKGAMIVVSEMLELGVDP